MNVVFRKKRYYDGKLRKVGDVVLNMNYKHARAFLNVKAAILYVAPPKKKKAPPLKLGTPVRTTIPVEETEIDAEVIPDTDTDTEDVRDEVIDDVVVDTEVDDTDTDTEDVVDTEVDDTDTDTEDVEDTLKDLSYRELQKACQEKGLSARGTKVELIDRLEA